MNRIAFALIACAATASTARAESWTVTDGSPPYLKNVWDISVDAGKIAASAGVADRPDDSRPGQRVSMSGVVLNGDHRLSLPASASGPGCLFVGKLSSSNEIVGVANCAGQSAVWHARRM